MILKARAQMFLQTRLLTLLRVQQALQKANHQRRMVWQLLVPREVVDVHHQKVCTFAACIEDT